MYPSFNQQAYLNELQNMKEKIERQMAQVTSSQNQVPSIQQTFQLANSNQNDFDGKFAKDIEEVKKTLVINNTIFINKEQNRIWIKNLNGEIKIYDLFEYVELDEKDKEIIRLKKEIESMKMEGIENAKHDNTNVNVKTSKSKSTNVSNAK